MNSKLLREKVKKYIDEADDRIVKMIYSMLEANRNDSWWDDLPASVKKSILKAEKQLDEGKGIPHEAVMRKYNKLLTK